MREQIVHRRFVLLLAALIVMFGLCIHPVALASDYDVTATVQAPIPPDPPVITNLTDNTTVISSTIEISGTCTVTVPPLIVELLRSGQVIGSTVCRPDGTFSAIVTLVLGVNIITPRFRTFTGGYGGEGTPFNLTYDPFADGETSTPSSTNRDVAQPALAQPSISRLESFIVFTPGEPVKLEFTISGGQKPYIILIDWGDNKVNKVETDEAGTVTLDHTYNKSGSHIIRIRLTDANKQLAILDVAAVTYAKYSGISGPQQLLTAHNNRLLKVYIPAGIVVVAIWLIAYKIGLRNAGKVVKTARKVQARKIVRKGR